MGGGDQPLACGMGVCFYGEIPSSQFITGNQLASTVGLTEGVNIFPNEPWLKFSLDGVILYISKKSIRHSISWNHLNSKNLVYGNKTITIQGKTYKIRLPKAIKNGNVQDRYDPSKSIYVGTNLFAGFDIFEANGSEWNRLMYPIFNGVHLQESIQDMSQHSDPLSLPFGTFANYSEADLNTDHRANLDVGGYTSWCQEDAWRDNNTSNNAAYGGYRGVTRYMSDPKTEKTTNVGWRPVLELVQ